MTRNPFPVVDLDTASRSLQELHSRVGSARTRVEISGLSGEVCVLISKAELEALERSIELLGDSELCTELHNTVATNHTAWPVPLVPALCCPFQL